MVDGEEEIVMEEVAEGTMAVEEVVEVVVTEMVIVTVMEVVGVMIVVTEDAAEEMTMTDTKQGESY